MWAYAALLAAVPLLAAAARLGPRAGRAAWALAWLGLVLFVGLRREIGADWDNYLVMFRRAGAYPPAEAATLSDPGYMLLSALIARLGLALPALNLACAALFATGLVGFARARELPWLALLVAIPVLVATVAMLSTRQSAAIGLWMWALAGYGGGARRWPPLLVALAVLFHWTAALLLPLVAIMAMRRPAPAAVAAAGAAAGIALAAAFQLVPELAARVAELAPSRGAPFRAAFTALALVALAAAWRQIAREETERRLAAYLAALGLFALALTPTLSAAGDRLGFYAIPLQMLVFARLAALAPPGRARAAARLAVAIPYAALFAAWLAASDYRRCLIPYRSYLADPAAILDPALERHHRAEPCMGPPSAPPPGI